MTDIPSSAFVGNTDTTTIEGARRSISDTFDNFLVLLTTQMQYQDPLDPADSTEFTNQLVQFANVEQQIAQSSKLDDLIGQQRTAITQTALSHIGLSVDVEGDSFVFGEEPVSLGVSFDRPAKEAALFIADSTGTALRKLDVPKDSGTHSVTWDGTDNDGNAVEPGRYYLAFSAVDPDGTPINDAVTIVPGYVEGVTIDGGEPNLIVNGSATPLSKVRAAQLP